MTYTTNYKPTEKDKTFNARADIEEISIINENLNFDDQYTDNYLSIEGFDMNLAAENSEKQIILKLNSQSDDVLIRKEGNT